MLAVATSAVRDAATARRSCTRRGDRLRAAPAVGEPKRRTRPFAASSRPARDAGAGVLVVDVGGGSTELVLGGPDGGVAWSCSLDVGCVRMTERFLGEADRREPDSTPGGHLRRLLAAVPDEVEDSVQRGVAVAGTATTGRSPRPAAPRRGCRARARRTSSRGAGCWRCSSGSPRMTVAERVASRACTAGRAPVIVGGLVVLGACSIASASTGSRSRSATSCTARRCSRPATRWRPEEGVRRRRAERARSGCPRGRRAGSAGRRGPGRCRCGTPGRRRAGVLPRRRCPRR